MASLDERLQDSKYANWLKVTYGLTRVKDGLVYVTTRIMSDFQEEILKQYNIVGACSSGSCTSKSVKNEDKFVCPNNVCNNFLRTIAAEHCNRKLIVWENCKVREWPESYWEIAKAYMPRGYRSCTGPPDTDCAGLLQLMRNCKLFRAKIQLNHDATEKVKLAVYICFYYSAGKRERRVSNTPMSVSVLS